ncbi:MAG: hypothetical protein M3440_13125, partial [Chloroflexota bacterium]|nr:hypothetical protein [Chloroflexota bacterium]
GTGIEFGLGLRVGVEVDRMPGEVALALDLSWARTLARSRLGLVFQSQAFFQPHPGQRRRTDTDPLCALP